jgi:hypothetical protein
VIWSVAKAIVLSAANRAFQTVGFVPSRDGEESYM